MTYQTADTVKQEAQALIDKNSKLTEDELVELVAKLKTCNQFGKAIIRNIISRLLSGKKDNEW